MKNHWLLQVKKEFIIDLEMYRFNLTLKEKLEIIYVYVLSHFNKYGGYHLNIGDEIFELLSDADCIWHTPPWTINGQFVKSSMKLGSMICSQNSEIGSCQFMINLEKQKHIITIINLHLEDHA